MRFGKSKIVHDRKSQTNEQLLDVTNNLRTPHDQVEAAPLSNAGFTP